MAVAVHCCPAVGRHPLGQGGQSRRGSSAEDYPDYQELPKLGNLGILANKGMRALLTTKLPNYPFFYLFIYRAFQNMHP